MKALFACLVFGLAASAPAAAFEFDSANCKTHLTGKWAGSGPLTMPGDEATIVGTTSWQAELAADGTFMWDNTLYAEGNPTPVVSQFKGGWDAKAGDAPMACVLALTPESGTGWSETLTITGPDTMTDGRGNPAKRIK
jgi:hypothetical protein